MVDKIEELIDSGLNYSQISKIVNLHRTTVSKICKDNNIKIKKIKHINCLVCKRSLKNNKRNNSKCKTCVTRLRRLRLKIKAIEYLGGKCVRCGYDDNLAALTFHHKEPEDKSFTISMVKHKSWEFIKPELDKCEILCANCHNVEHSKYEEIDLLKFL